MNLNKKLIIIFSAIFIVFAVAAAIINNIQPTDSTALISVDGEIIREVDLTHEQTFDIKTQYGKNSISVINGMIYITDADCPDKLCVRHGKLHNKYDAIVCLPHKIVIEYKNGHKDIAAVAGR